MCYLINTMWSDIISKHIYEKYIQVCQYPIRKCNFIRHNQIATINPITRSKSMVKFDIILLRNYKSILHVHIIPLRFCHWAYSSYAFPSSSLSISLNTHTYTHKHKHKNMVLSNTSASNSNHDDHDSIQSTFASRYVRTSLPRYIIETLLIL